MGIRVVNHTRHTVLVTDGEISTNLVARLRGLIGRPALRPGQGVLITPCNAIHTLGMRYAVDVLFVDRNSRIIKAVSSVPPNRLGPVAWCASSVLEVEAGTIDRTETRSGDQIEMITE